MFLAKRKHPLDLPLTQEYIFRILEAVSESQTEEEEDKLSEDNTESTAMPPSEPIVQAPRPVELPQLQLLSRVQELPLVELALNTSARTYARIKDSHQLVFWALATAESSIAEASRQALPYASRLNTPISYVDQKLCLGLDIVEQKVPIVKMRPETIVENIVPAVKPITAAADYLLEHASNMKAVGWNKANEILSTRYGSMAVQGIDNTANVLDALIEKYFPALEQEDCSETVPLEEDKLLHTLQTLGRLPVKAARRLYGRVARQLPSLGAESFRSYMAELLEFLRLARHLGDGEAATSLGMANGRMPLASSPAVGSPNSRSHVSFASPGDNN